MEGGNYTGGYLLIWNTWGKKWMSLMFPGLNGSIQYQIDANYLPDGWRSYMARAVKGKIRETLHCCRKYPPSTDRGGNPCKGDADFIGMGRGLIAEPEWVNKGRIWKRM